MFRILGEKRVNMFKNLNIVSLINLIKCLQVLCFFSFLFLVASQFDWPITNGNGNLEAFQNICFYVMMNNYFFNMNV